MSESGGAVEHTTAMAVTEKAKLQKNLRRFDMLFFSICALVGVDTLGQVASFGVATFTWIAVLAVVFLLPYALVMAELGSAFPQEGGPYEWMKMSFGRLAAGIGSILYWVTNPLWVGGTLCFTATAAFSAQIHTIGTKTPGDYAFKIIFIWIAIGVAIVSLRHGKWIPNVGAIIRLSVLGFFSFTVLIFAIKHGVHGPSLKHPFGHAELQPARALPGAGASAAVQLRRLRAAERGGRGDGEPAEGCAGDGDPEHDRHHPGLRHPHLRDRGRAAGLQDQRHQRPDGRRRQDVLGVRRVPPTP